ncbi:MAG: hypothetical protein HQL22_07205 [Candidatus Omnitrophica bacterium]|nr:hypothetical protein [Candidatus Omnitrophota bacterium]
MVRAIISLHEDEKAWLDRYSRRKGQSVAETIRLAVRQLRNAERKAVPEDVLNRVSGLWKNRKINALDYVEQQRSEWGR